MFETEFSIYHLEYILLIFIRIASMIYLVPVFGSTGVPNKVKIGFSAVLAILLATVIPYEPLPYISILGYSGLVIKEVMIGLLIGFFMNICMTILSFAGQMIDQEIGFTMVSIFDQFNKTQSTITANLYNILVLLIVVVSDLYYFIIDAMVDSFRYVPVGTSIYKMDAIYHIFLKFMKDFFLIGFQIALPIFASALLLSVILGILAKAAPQMNMFVVGIQLKVFLGLAVLFVTIGFLPNVAEYIFDEMKTFVELLYGAMS